MCLITTMTQHEYIVSICSHNLYKATVLTIMCALFLCHLKIFSCSQHRVFFFFFFSSRRRHTRLQGDWSSDVCSSDLRCQHDSNSLSLEGKTSQPQRVEDDRDRAEAHRRARDDRTQQEAEDRVEHEIGRASCRERV